MLQIQIIDMAEREEKNREELIMAQQQAEIMQSRLEGSQNQLTEVLSGSMSKSIPDWWTV